MRLYVRKNGVTKQSIARDSAQVTYQWRKFKNEARKDGLELEHWVKCYRDHLGKIRPENEGEYKYAKYDRKVMASTLVLRSASFQP